LSLWAIRGDLTSFKDDAYSSHEFQTGLYGAPLSKYDTENICITNGFILEERSVLAEEVAIGRTINVTRASHPRTRTRDPKASAIPDDCAKIGAVADVAAAIAYVFVRVPRILRSSTCLRIVAARLVDAGR